MTAQPTSLMASALQGPPDPAMSALFSKPTPQLQQMAGDVVPFRQVLPPMTLQGVQDWKEDLAKIRTQNTLNRALGVSNVIPMTPNNK
jgi:hypothetical protein